MSTDPSENVSRRDEIRAFFIFGLLAVFASIRVQYSLLTIKLAYGSVNLVTFIDILIALWSLYAFFMVIGLSGDVVPKMTADVFRQVSKIFLQWSYIILAVLAIPLGFAAFGLRFILLGSLILLVACVGFIVYQSQRKSSQKPKRTLRLKDKGSFILGLVFLFSTYAMGAYPQDWIDSEEIIIVSYIIAAVFVTIYIVIQKPKDKDTYTSDDDYYY